jgi:hypothetical protein
MVSGLHCFAAIISVLLLNTFKTLFHYMLITKFFGKSIGKSLPVQGLFVACFGQKVDRMLFLFIFAQQKRR